MDQNIFLDGGIAVHVQDLRSVRRRRKTAAFVQRALDPHGEWPPVLPDGLDLSGTRKLIASAGRLFSLVVLLTE